MLMLMLRLKLTVELTLIGIGWMRACVYTLIMISVWIEDCVNNRNTVTKRLN